MKDNACFLDGQWCHSIMGKTKKLVLEEMEEPMGELLCGDIQDMVLEQIPKLEINLGMRAINKIQSNKSCGCRALMPILSWVIVYKLKTESQSRTLKKNTGGGRKPAIENKHQEVMNLSFRDISKNCIVHNRHSKNMKRGGRVAWGRRKIMCGHGREENVPKTG